MRIHNLINQLSEFDPDLEVSIVCPSGKELVIEDVDITETGEVYIEAAEEIK